MRLLVMRRSESVGRSERPGVGDSWADRIVVPLEGPERDRGPWATVADRVNLLAGAVPALPEPPCPPRVIAWSGWLPADAAPQAGVFPRNFRTWTPEAWETFEKVVANIGPALAAKKMSLLLRPHARHVLSDAQGCRQYMERAPEGVNLLLDPASMLTPDMLPDAEDHLARTLDALAAHPKTAGIVLCNVRRVPGDDSALAPSPLHAGEIDPAMFRGLVAEFAPKSLPAVVLEEQLPRQLAIFRAGEARA